MSIPFVYSYRGIAVRKGSSSMAVGGIALVVLVFVSLLALAAGLRAAVSSSGSPNNVLIIRKGADAELQSQVTRDSGRILSELPCVASDASGRKLFSTESLIIFNRKKKDGGVANISVRGVPEIGPSVHTGLQMIQGRWMTPGTDEAVIGVGLARRLEGFSLGQSVDAGRHDWKIVGVFEAAGSSLESEMWIDVDQLQNAFNRGSIFQSFLFRASGDPKAATQTMEDLFSTDPRLHSMMAQQESAYYTKQAQLMATVITVLGGILTAIMAMGAIVGAMNTMYASVSQRKREIGCLLAMGFTPGSIWAAFLLESLLLSILGAIIGSAIAMLLNGMKTGTTNWATFSETAFEFRVTPGILIVASLLALVMGFIGGMLPAISAARMKVVDALRRT